MKTDNDDKVFIGGPELSIEKGQVGVYYFTPASYSGYYNFIIAQGAEMTIRGTMNIDRPSNNNVDSAHYQVAGRPLIDTSMLYGGRIDVITNGQVHLSKNVELKLYDSVQVDGALMADQGAMTGETGAKINFEDTNDGSVLNGQTPDKAVYHWQGGTWVK